MARPKFPSDEQAQFVVRMPPDLRERIRIAAEKNKRSMNAEILSTLEEVYPRLIDENEYYFYLHELSDMIGGSSQFDEKIKSRAKRLSEILGPRVAVLIGENEEDVEAENVLRRLAKKIDGGK